MVLQEKLYTVAEFWDIAQQAEYADKRLELINGMIIEMPPSSPANSMIGSFVIYLLLSYILPKGSGYVTGPDGGYQVGPHTVCQPDAAYISKARAGDIPKKVFPIGPDLAVEVISPSETSRSILDKVRLYLAAGSLAVWAIDPDTKKVDVYSLADRNDLHGELRVQTLGVDDTLSAGDALPGFSVKVQELFAVLER